MHLYDRMNTMTTTKSAQAEGLRVLGRCPWPGCRTRVNVEAYESEIDRRDPRIPLAWTAYAGTEFREGTMPISSVTRNEMFGMCLEHRYSIAFKRIRVQTSAEPCGPACWDATGSDCRCSCGGSNHGAGR